MPHKPTTPIFPTTGRDRLSYKCTCMCALIVHEEFGSAHVCASRL